VSPVSDALIERLAARCIQRKLIETYSNGVRHMIPIGVRPRGAAFGPDGDGRGRPLHGGSKPCSEQIPD
jgi:hypothetical protein